MAEPSLAGRTLTDIVPEGTLIEKFDRALGIMPVAYPVGRLFKGGCVLSDTRGDCGGHARIHRALISTGFGVWLRLYRRRSARRGSGKR